MHVDDEILDFAENALEIQELTNCSVIPITGFLLGGAHNLFSDEVLIKSINWFEQHFFKSDTINGSIFITFYWNYVFIIINLVLIVIAAVYLISISSRLFFKKRNEINEFKSINRPTINKKKQIFKILFYTGAFLLNWVVFGRFFGAKGVLYASLNMILMYIIIKSVLHFKKPKDERTRQNIVEMIRSQLKLKYIIFVITSISYFLLLYMVFSFYYPFGFIWPSNFTVHFGLAFLILPIYLSIEILLRKVIYPLLSFSKSETSKTKVIIITAIILIISLTTITSNLSGFPSGVLTTYVFLIVIILNTKIFENLKSFYPITLITFLVIQIFIATLLSNAIGVNMAI
jgi:hypothetical protein